MRFYEWFFRKSDGSWARLRETEAFGERGTAQYIFDTGKRTMIRVDGFTRSAIVFRLPDEPVFRGYLEQPGTCKWLTDGTRKRLAESERLGLRVVEIAAGLDTKLWVAPELECFPLLELLIEDGVVRTKEEVLWLEFGEPDSNPFLIPSGFVEVSPLQFNELRKQRFQGRSDYREEELLQKLERDYQYGLSKSPGAK